MRQGKERRRNRIGHNKTAEGHVSHAMGCHPSQAQEFTEIYRQHGITGAHHRPSDGKFVYDSRKSRAEVMKLRGMIDKDAGYSDYAGK